MLCHSKQWLSAALCTGQPILVRLTASTHSCAGLSGNFYLSGGGSAKGFAHNRRAHLPPEELDGADLDALGMSEAARPYPAANRHARQQTRLQMQGM